MSTQSKLCTYQFEPQFRWEINQFSVKRKFAQESTHNYLLSEPFYPHKPGYKFCLTILPGGCHASNREYLPVGFHVMQGQNDSKLAWPMMSTVTIAIVNQESNTAYKFVKHNYDSTPDEYKNHFNRPIIRMNKIVRTICFIRFDELSTNQNLYRNVSIILTCYVNK